MKECTQCGHAMIRASMYDPDGAVPLYGGVKEYKDGALSEWWVCNNSTCSEGAKNTGVEINK